jgi:hypothetical protein
LPNERSKRKSKNGNPESGSGDKLNGINFQKKPISGLIENLKIKIPGDPENLTL